MINARSSGSFFRCLIGDENVVIISVWAGSGSTGLLAICLLIPCQ
jgi:hypothetical protein